ncbi:flagellin N-terminal helical domain-containing protein [Bacillus tuaregi]|uniref:flagellin N-terminal helical domain-containing protein n=1 Tax=Bacillus tuaregi TaxID=1816695 RepID=UPI000A9B85C4|nr:flagellin [Bacillus tuaregi]
MKINHNIQALNAYRNLYQNQMNTSKNLEKLSSGLRINRAADDAAGLAISEKMRSQITGLKQAERNSLDGISLMQTAEGAMTEIHSMLQRMRELAVQASNDTNTTSDRQAIQLEVDQLNLEIDSIAAKTEFNTRKLLDGSSAADTQYIVGEMEKTNITQVPRVIDASLETGRYEIGVMNEPTLTYKLNQPGAGVSRADVIKIETDAIFRADEAAKTNFTSAPTIVDKQLQMEDASYQVRVDDKTYTPTLINETAGFTPANVTNFSISNSDTSTLAAGSYTVEVSVNSTDNSKYDVRVSGPGGYDKSLTGVALANELTFGTGTEEIKIAGGTLSSEGSATIDVALNKTFTPSSTSGNISDASGFQISNPNTTTLTAGDYTIDVAPNAGGGYDVTITGAGGAFTDTKTGVDITTDLTFGTGTTEITIAAGTITGDGNATVAVALAQTYTPSLPANTGITADKLSVFKPESSELTAGEYTINVTNGATPGSYDISVTGPDDYNVVITNANPASEIKIGPDNQQIVIAAGTINSAGSAKINIAATADISLEKLDKSDGQYKQVGSAFNDVALTNGKVQLSGFEVDLNKGLIEGTSKFDITASDLALGEYTIVVSDYQLNSDGKKSATIEVFDPTGSSIGQLASYIGEGGEEQTIGSSNGKQVKIDTSLITQAGTAKVQIENKLMVSVSKVKTDEDGNQIGDPTPITFQKEITTVNGKIQHGGLELTFGASARQGASQFDLTNKALSFQIGANKDQAVFIDVPELSTVKLGIDGINVMSQDGANDAIFRIDQAITEISATRSKLGATQNRLEHTINNLQVTSENLTSAESRIRDADMALEMTEFTKNNILNQSAQAMLSQANQLPQGILQLLQR